MTVLVLVDQALRQGSENMKIHEGETCFVCEGIAENQQLKKPRMNDAAWPLWIHAGIPTEISVF